MVENRKLSDGAVYGSVSRDTAFVTHYFCLDEPFGDAAALEPPMLLGITFT